MFDQLKWLFNTVMSKIINCVTINLKINTIKRLFQCADLYMNIGIKLLIGITVINSILISSNLIIFTRNFSGVITTIAFIVLMIILIFWYYVITLVKDLRQNINIQHHVYQLEYRLKLEAMTIDKTLKDKDPDDLTIGFEWFFFLIPLILIIALLWCYFDMLFSSISLHQQLFGK